MTTEASILPYQMTTCTHSKTSMRIAVIAILLSLSLSSLSSARGQQNPPEPRHEELLNGLRVLIWSQPTNVNVTVALRIHSGAAFDLAGKSGTMALLADQLFPDPETHDFFVEELGGNLQVTVDYDAMNITMTGRASEFERMLEILRTALISTPVTTSTVARLREARIKANREMSMSPPFIADRAIARRLFGDYPYGQPIIGTPETLVRIDRADLLLARERFHNPDNGTLVVIGGVQETRALRALRQLLGAWRKSDKVAPSTFRMPDNPDARTLIVDIPSAEDAEVRMAIRSLPRSDRDQLVVALLTLLTRDRWRAALPDLDHNAFYVRDESYFLSGMFVLGASVRTKETGKVIETGRNIFHGFVDSPPTSEELERVRNELVLLLTKGLDKPATIADMWLDAESYKLPSIADQVRALKKITPTDVQRVAVRLFRDASLASVVVGNSTLIKPDLERSVKVEIPGANRETAPPAVVTPSKNP